VCEVRRVVLPALEDESAARVGGDSFAQVARQLSQMLVGDGERETEAPRFSENAAERARAAEEVLELVDEEKEVRPRGFLSVRSREDFRSRRSL
jgi:hypothetical protein